MEGEVSAYDHVGLVGVCHTGEDCGNCCCVCVVDVDCAGVFWYGFCGGITVSAGPWPTPDVNGRADVGRYGVCGIDCCKYVGGSGDVIDRL